MNNRSTGPIPASDPNKLLSVIRQRSRAIAMVWLAVTFLWVVVIFATEIPAWTIVIWIATTIGPVTALERAHRQTRG